jgi:arginyl-tRNA synthetase
MNANIEPLVSLIATATELEPEDVAGHLGAPPDPNLGDFAFPCFPLAKVWRKNPAQIAADVAARLTDSGSDLIADAQAAGPYVNIRLAHDPFQRQVLGAIDAAGEAYGASGAGADKTVIIDYSSPNMAKPFHVGHLSSTIIGGSLAHLFAFDGYRVVGINHLGDWGTPVGQQIVAFQKWGDEAGLAEHPIEHMVGVYQKFHAERESNPKLMDEARDWFRKLEEGDAEARSFWERIRTASISELEKAYNRLGVRFDHYHGESFYEEMLDDTVDAVKATGITDVSDGALIVPLEEQGIKVPLILVKSDGATIYATRDIAAARYRAAEFEFDQCLYVVARDQELHFEQLFTTIGLMGAEWASNLHHVKFGHVHGMSTRKGGAILLDELLDRAVEKVREVIDTNRETMFSDLDDEEVSEVAESVGVGAVIFGTLNRKRVRDIEFSWETALTFAGETGPYVQYAHARMCSIIRKADREIPASPDWSLLTHDAEWTLIKALGTFPDAVSSAVEQYEPSYVVRYLVDLAQDFTRFYDQCRVLGDDEALTGARLALIDRTRRVIKTGLGLLCIKAPERM